MQRRAVSKLTLSLVALLAVVPAALVGCATTKVELIANEENYQTWRVNASISRVFKTYRNYAQESFSNTLKFGTGVQIDGDFFGDTADLSVTQLAGFPILKRSTSLYFDLSTSGHSTVVEAWTADEGWRERAKAFKTLLPSTARTTSRSIGERSAD